MTGKDWMLLALAAAKAKGLTIPQLERTLFVLGRELTSTRAAPYYTFAAGDYGPFDAAVHADARSLEADGLAHAAHDDFPPVYATTRKGLQAARQFAQQVPQEELDCLRRTVKWARRLSFPELVTAIYAKYPDISANSVFHA